MPEVPGVMTSDTAFSTLAFSRTLPILPATSPAPPSHAALARMLGGNTMPATTPATMPHLRPFLVWWSVSFSMVILPAVSAWTTSTPSMW